MRVLITGAAGFLGSHLVEKFIQNGYSVTGIDNLVTGSVVNIVHIDSDKFTFMEGDITKPFLVKGPLEGILHFASPASPIDFERIPLEIMDVNSLGTRNCLELARQKKTRFFMASTSEVYGDPEIHPQKETYFGNVNPRGIRSVYDEAKRFSEAMIYAYQRLYNVDVRVVRIFNTYGPRMRPHDGRVVPTFIRQALEGEPLTIFGKGEQTRSFCYVDDLVEGIFRLYQSNYTEPVNIGNPGEFTIMELAQEIETILDKKLEMVFKPMPENDPKKRRPDISLAREILDWEPKIPLKEGLKKTIDWFLKD